MDHSLLSVVVDPKINKNSANYTDKKNYNNNKMLAVLILECLMPRLTLMPYLSCWRK